MRSSFMSIFIIVLLAAPFTYLTTGAGNNSGNAGQGLIPDSSANAMRWRLVGPFRAGRALAAEGISSKPSTFYFGAVDGGIWKTTNAGLTWDQISDGQVSPSIGALTISSSDPNIIYAGTGEADMRSDITYGDGVYKSNDGGKHWVHIGLEDTRHIGKILIDPADNNIVLVAALGHAYGPNKERGVFRTTDGGKTWKKVLYKNAETGAVDMAIDQSSPKIIYAAMWNAHRTAWSQYPPEEGKGSGLYKSTDEGITWHEIKGDGFPKGDLGRIGVSVVYNSGGKKVYAIVQSLKDDSGLYYSEDGGEHWVLKSTNSQIITRMWYFGRVFVDPVNSDIIYIPTKSIFRSTDAGKTWNAIKGSPGGDDYHYMWIDPMNDNHLIVASDQGTAVSLDKGETWSSWYNQPTAQFYHVATDNRFPYRIYGAQQDAGTVSITSRSDYGQITYRDWYSIGAGESGYIAPDPDDPDIDIGGNTYGGLYRFNKITGQSQNISPWLLSTFSQPAPERKYRFTWTSPVGFDPNNKSDLYFGSQVLLKTTDGGLHWSAVSPDLTETETSLLKPNEHDNNSEDASHKGWGVIYSFSISPVKKGMIWTGTDNGYIQLTKDSGKTWENVTPPAIKRWSKICIIEASPFNAAAAYAAVDRHRRDDFHPYIYRTTDYGKTWERIDKGIPDKSFVRVVRADPVKKGLLYAGTETGVYVSFNDGDDWQPLQLNLPVVSVRDLAIHDNDLIAATHGRAFWVLDDVTPLRQVNDDVLNSKAFLFKPEDVYRLRRDVNTDTPLPPEEPHGDNPSAGAIIDYYLDSDITGNVELQIFDKDGNPVRSYSNNDKQNLPKEQTYFMEAWLPQFHPLTAHKGINRFVWDLMYTPPPTDYYNYSMQAVAGKGTTKEPLGPILLPGEYTIKLKVGGKYYSRELTVKKDPREIVSNDELKDQLMLAGDIWNAVAEQTVYLDAVRSVETQINMKMKKVSDNPGLLTMVNELKDKVSAVKDSLDDSGLAYLESTVMRADREPTEAMYTAYKILNNRYGNAEKKLDDVLSNDVKKINDDLSAHGIMEIKVDVKKAERLKY